MFASICTLACLPFYYRHISTNPHQNDKVSIVRNNNTHVKIFVKICAYLVQTCYCYKCVLAGAPLFFFTFQCITYARKSPCIMESSQAFFFFQILSIKIFA